MPKRKTDINYEIPTIENPRINILHNSHGMRPSPLASSPPWSHIKKSRNLNFIERYILLYAEMKIKVLSLPF